MRPSFPSFPIAYLLLTLLSAFLIYAAPQVASGDDAAAAAATSTLTLPGWTSTVTALTFFTPSSGAEPIPITSQSQLVTSYVPVLTVCPYAPSFPALVTAAANASLPGNTSVIPSAATRPTAVASNVSGLYRRQAAASSAPYANSSAPTSYLTSCSVSYTPTTTQICHTTLSPLASPVIPVTDCEQQITFSTDHGYTVIPGNRTVNVQGLTTYYAAQWDDIATGVPQGGIQKEVCSTTSGCSTEWEAWSTGVVRKSPPMSLLL
ncbi:MAG: hypothetical protein Q9191_002051 [Dirinaria sp. TL-2023a]